MKTIIGIAVASLLLLGVCEAQSSLVGPGSSYTNIFSPSVTNTFDVPGGGLLSLTISNGSSTVSSGVWDLTSQGGANATIGLSLLESAAQTQLTGSALKFNVSNDNNALLGLLGTGTSLHYGWTSTAYFDTPGSVLNYTPFTTYHVSFNVDGTNGLLSSVAGLTPTFSFELIDGLGNPLSSTSYGSLVDIAGVLGGGVPTGTVNLDYVLNGSAPTGAIGVRFTGDALLNASALSLGTDYATISNISISATPVPEPSGALLIAAVGLAVVIARSRHRSAELSTHG